MQSIQLPTSQTEALKLHIERVVQTKTDNFPLIFTVVYAAWKLWAGISKLHFKRKMSILEYYFFWYALCQNAFFFSIGEDPCLLGFIFKGRRDWKMACDLITSFCVLTSNHFFIEFPVKD